jgi:hypothetical protein
MCLQSTSQVSHELRCGLCHEAAMCRMNLGVRGACVRVIAPGAGKRYVPAKYDVLYVRTLRIDRTSF